MAEWILAIGAAGPKAGLVVPALARRGARVRGFVRKIEQLDKVRAAGADDAVLGDLADPESLMRAMAGVSGIFYLAPVFADDEVRLGLNMLDAALRSGVGRIVFSSVIHPVLNELSNHAAKAEIEQAILDSGLDYVFLHPALFFQNFKGAWPRIVETGVLAEPWSAENRFSRVDYRDVAEVAAIALTEDRLSGGTYELCADEGLNRHEVAAIVSKVLGRDIRAERADSNEAAKPGTPMRAMIDHYDRVGLVGNSLTLRTILQREPRTLEIFFQELSQGLRPTQEPRNR